MTPFTVAAVLVALVAALLLSRAATWRRVRRTHTPPHPVAQDGVIEGAGPVHLVGTGDRAVLLLHGFNDTPQSVSQLARALHERGWSVIVPLLPHHGRGPDDLERHGQSDEWVAHARSEWAALRARTPRAVLAGQSMGGAIAVVLAAEAAPSALVLLAPYLSMGRLTRLLARIWPVWQLAVPQLVADPRRGLLDPTARAQTLGGGRFSPRLVFELDNVVVRARAALGRVGAPTLVLHAKADYRIPSRSAAQAFARLGAQDKTLIWRENTGHVLAADVGREGVYAIVGDWLDQRVPPVGH